MTNAVEISCYIIVGIIMIVILYLLCIKPFLKKKNKNKKEDINNTNDED